ncbi:MAG: 3-phosphoserine/phosphohydroxythreonine transaminase [Sulfuriferula multivorans]|uniref:Phosphoserine aminotransferase n=1 Tax=Sulfuriferula multivorans TaxID=1559896 RepID=A0A7C9NZL3_9PROT|nr:3-phosphoserine/phosphohydroxythreonine transaminase [Sulfuriferula multivorans]
MTIYNFSAGPAVLPKDVLQQVQAEMVDWHGSGMSVMEMSHRGKEFMGIAAEAEADLRELMGIPANYKVLFLQGGASSQFAMVPMNLLRGKTGADYLNTGEWSKKAIKEAKRYSAVNVVATSEDKNFSYAPAQDQWKLDPNAAYVHYTPNETIGGVEIFWTPELGTQPGDVPLVADMSSTILSRPIDVSKFGLIYAGAQKNIGPAGLTIVIVRDDLMGQTMAGTPSMFDYKIHADNESMYNTPPTFGMYTAGLVFKWLKARGGLAAMEKTNREKAGLLYDALDTTDFYTSPVAKDNRSLMNVPFVIKGSTLKDAALDEAFLKLAKERSLLQLKGHRSVGGMRASIYNAMPIEGVRALVDMMRAFEKSHG